MNKQFTYRALYFGHVGLYAFVWLAALAYMLFQPQNPSMQIMIVAGMVFAPLLVAHTYFRYRAPEKAKHSAQVESGGERQAYREGFADGIEYAGRLSDQDKDHRLTTRQLLTDDGEIVDLREKQKTR